MTLRVPMPPIIGQTAVTQQLIVDEWFLAMNRYKKA
jgi:hypothetical protein